MLKLLIVTLFTFSHAPWSHAQMPPPPPQDDFPKPLPPEGKKKSSKKTKLHETERSGVKPPMPVTPPTPEPTVPTEGNNEP